MTTEHPEEWITIKSQNQLRELRGRHQWRNRTGERLIRVPIQTPKEQEPEPLIIELRQAFELLKSVKKNPALVMLAHVYGGWMDLYVTAIQTPEQRAREAVINELLG